MKRTALRSSAYSPRAVGLVVCAVVLALAASTQVSAADLSARQVTELLFAATAERETDLSDHDLSNLDLSGLDFKSAKLMGVDLFGADLRGADLAGVDLTDARLDRTVLIGTDFTEASLNGASILRPSAFTTLEAVGDPRVVFAKADLRDAKIFGRFNHADFRGADLSGAMLAPFGNTGFIEHIWRSEFLGADLTGAKLRSARLNKVLFRFALLVNADLSNASLVDADLSRADLTGADLTGADVTGADLDGTILTGAQGLDTVKGLQTTKNSDRVVR